MGLRIEDGRGNGYQAGVTKQNRAMIESTRVLEALNVAIEESGTFLISSGLITVSTTDTDTGILYVKNSHTDSLILDTLVLASNNLVCKWKIVTSLTTGTLISAGTDVVPTNSDLASARPAVGVFKYGANGLTVTNGTSLFLGMSVGTGIRFDGGHLPCVLRTGAAIALVANVPASTIVNVFVVGYYRSDQR